MPSLCAKGCRPAPNDQDLACSCNGSLPAAQDLKVLAAARNIGQHMPGCKVIIDKNRVPVGTAELVQAAVAQELAERGLDIEFSGV